MKKNYTLFTLSKTVRLILIFIFFLNNFSFSIGTFNNTKAVFNSKHFLPPVVTLAPFNDVCDNASAFTLTGGSPAGGIYSGPGVDQTGTKFDPSLVGPGTYTIAYTVIIGGVPQSATNTITINPSPNKNVIVSNPETGKVFDQFIWYGQLCDAFMVCGSAHDITFNIVTPIAGINYSWTWPSYIPATLTGTNSPTLKVHYSLTGDSYGYYLQNGDTIRFYGSLSGLTLTQTNQWGCKASFGYEIYFSRPTVPSFISDTVCLGVVSQFKNTTTFHNGMSQSTPDVSWWWDFGDGSTSTDKDPSHTFLTPGNHKVKIVTTLDQCSTCTDTVVQNVYVRPVSGPPISMSPMACAVSTTFCPGATTTFYTDPNCAGYNWSVVGGAIVGGQNTTQVQVTWGNSATGGSVTLATTNCSPNQCSQPTKFDVPVLTSSSTINGPSTICTNDYSPENYSVTDFPGAIYTWTINPGTAGTIASGQGTNGVSVNWSHSPATATISVHITHPRLTCQNNSTLNINILPNLQITGASVCSGGTQTFTVPASGAVNWTASGAAILSGQGTNAVSIKFLLAGSHTITAKAATGGTYCSDSTAYGAWVDSVPGFDTITGQTFICPNTMYKYTAVTAQTGNNYVWTPTNGTVTTTSGKDVWITWGATGPYILTGSQARTYPPYCASTTYVLNVYDNNNSPPIGGNASGCRNEKYIYSVPKIPGATYNWTVVPSTSASIIGGQGTSSVKLQYTASGAATVKVDINLCGTPTTSSLIININPSPAVPVITTAGYLCITGSKAMTLSTTAGYSSYLWTFGSDTNGTANSATITQAGEHHLTVTNSFGCPARTKITIKYSPKPLAVISTPDPENYTNCDVINTNLHSLQPFPGTYQWYKDGLPVGAGGLIYNATATGAYTLKITNSFGCTDSSRAITIDASTPCGQTICTPICSTYPVCSGCTESTATVSATDDGAPFFHLYNGGGKTDPLMELASTEKHCDNTISFDNTTANVSAYYWDFNDGNTSTLKSPTNTFSYPGFYYVGAYVRFNNGQTGKKFKAIEIPFAVKFREEFFCHTVNFIDQSLYTTNSPITSYSWDFGDGSGTSTAQSPTYTFAAAGTYTVTLTCSDGTCIKTFTDVVTISPGPTAQFAVPPACYNSPSTFTDGSFNNIDEWSWDFGDGFTDDTQNPVHTYGVGGTYNVTLTVKDNEGCSATTNHSVTVISPTTGGVITAGGPITFCPGNSVTLTAPVAASYVWFNGSTLPSITAAATGDYSCTVTYANGCQENIASTTVVVKPAPTAKITNPVTGLCSGSGASINTTYSSTYTYAWYNSGGVISGQTFSGYYVTSTGTYTVIVTDGSSGCTASTSISILNNFPTPSVSVSGPTSVCSGQQTTLTATGSSGTAPYHYTWMNSSYQTFSKTNKAVLTTGGSYITYITDLNGCTSSWVTTTLTTNPSPDISSFVPGCYDMCLLDTLLSGIPGMATYKWLNNNVPVSPNGTNQNLIVNTSGVYKLIVSTSAGCIDTTNALTLNVKPLPTVSAGPDLSMCASAGETVTLAGSGAGTYSWSPAVTLSSSTIATPVASPSGTTSYTLTLTGTNGCRNKDTVNVLVSCSNPKVNITGTKICASSCASITAAGGGGTAPYSYTWSDGKTGAGPHAFCPSSTTTYTITITDVGGNTATDTAQVVVGQAMINVATVTNPNCNGENSGKISVTTTAGFSPYTYLWNNGQTAQAAVGLASGSYTVTITDAAGCTATTTSSILAPAQLGGEFTKGTAACGSCGCREWLMVNATGGTTPYSYTWQNGYKNRYQNHLCQGTYLINIKDKNGCTINLNLTAP